MRRLDLPSWVTRSLRACALCVARALTPHRRALPAPDPSAPSEGDGAPWLEALRGIIGLRRIIVIANSEPYIHQRRGDKIELVRPASGLVAALEPTLRHCGGLWIGHGSGTADRETTGPDSELAVPPDSPSYRLRRVWLTPEEEQGYYYGLANEGLWPLCHLAHTRPVFRLADWERYRAVNERFASATPEVGLDGRSVILVQDYHFALLPRMLRARVPEGAKTPRIGIFWHIPWPNPEAFGICPWSKEILTGMLGADVIGFHTQYHCNNFLETCDRLLEARIDRERFSVTMEGRETLVRAFPIGIETTPVRTLDDGERAALKEKYGIRAERVAVGVDRLDYTKGLVERVRAVERFLETHPEYVGRFAFVQIGSPTRATIAAYRTLSEELEAAVAAVNARFGSGDYRPVVLIARHHEWDEIQYFYQLGDVCLVTSLHDGMNLVAKEYVWCQRPERGALVLSKFTGASRELTDAFIVNPYSIEEMAEAIAQALLLPAGERARRMRAMRAKVERHNAFHWASDLIRVLVNDVTPPRRTVSLRPSDGARARTASRAV
jgi:trehalose 6-phosphate synthase